MAVGVAQVVDRADGEERELRHHRQRRGGVDQNPARFVPISPIRQKHQEREQEYLVRHGIEEVSELLVVTLVQVTSASCDRPVQCVEERGGHVDRECGPVKTTPQEPEDGPGQEGPDTRDPVGVHMRRQTVGERAEDPLNAAIAIVKGGVEGTFSVHDLSLSIMNLLYLGRNHEESQDCCMMNKKIRVSHLILLLVCIDLGLLYFQITSWNKHVLGRTLFLVFVLSIGWWWKEILHRAFGLRSNVTTYLLGVFAGFTTLGLLAGVFAVWYRFTPFTVWSSYAETALIIFFIYLWVKKKPACHSKPLQEHSISPTRKVRFRIPSFFILIYLAGWVWGLSLLFKSQSQTALLSPWQTISHSYLYVFFVLSLLLGLFLFSQFKVKLLLFLVILHSVLLHMYLPASHVLPWGGDVWRMLAVENKLLQGEAHPPVLFGEGMKWREIGSISVPEALVIPHKYVYGQLWGTSVVMAKTTGVDLLQLNRWLSPLLWSVFFPLVMFRLGVLLFGSQRWGVWFAALSFLPFIFQVTGSLTLGVSLGYLTFFFVLLLLLHWIRDGYASQRILVLFFAILMAFGYTVVFVLLWFLLSTYLLYWGVAKLHRVWLKRIITSVIILLSICVFPVIEILLKASSLPAVPAVVHGVKQAVGQLSGWFFASQIRPHDIVSGNILFNHTPLVSFVPSVFINWRWHIMGFMVALFALAFVGAASFPARRRAQLLHLVLLTAGVCVWGGYVISWFFLEGERSFVRRLDAALVFFLFVFAIYGVQAATRRWSFSRRQLTSVIVLLVCAISWTTMTTYASGPDTQVMSSGQYQAAQYVWSELKFQPDHCVIADTWPLLGVEAVSSGQIVGGGFPISSTFAQPERVEMYRKILALEPTVTLEIQQYVHGSGCWAIVPVAQELFPEATSTQVFGDVRAFFLPLKTGTE